MVAVAVTRDQFEARVIAARLGSEGIVWELRGASGGPYPVGQVSVLVERADLEVAREVLGAGGLAGEGGDTSERAPLLLWLALLVIVAIAAAGLLRAMAAAS